MSYDLPSVEQLRAQLQEFDSGTYPDDAVDSALVLAGRQVDETWLEDDYQYAVIYLAAHLLAVAAAGADTLGQDDLRSISIGPLSLSYGDKVQADSLKSTIYGQTFAQIRRRNVGGPITV